MSLLDAGDGLALYSVVLWDRCGEEGIAAASTQGRVYTASSQGFHLFMYS